jgi:hypothetical protein
MEVELIKGLGRSFTSISQLIPFMIPSDISKSWSLSSTNVNVCSPSPSIFTTISFGRHTEYIHPSKWLGGARAQEFHNDEWPSHTRGEESNHRGKE